MYLFSRRRSRICSHCRKTYDGEHHSICDACYGRMYPKCEICNKKFYNYTNTYTICIGNHTKCEDCRSLRDGECLGCGTEAQYDSRWTDNEYDSYYKKLQYRPPVCEECFPGLLDTFERKFDSPHVSKTQFLRIKFEENDHDHGGYCSGAGKCWTDITTYKETFPVPDWWDKVNNKNELVEFIFCCIYPDRGPKGSGYCGGCCNTTFEIDKWVIQDKNRDYYCGETRRVSEYPSTDEDSDLSD